MNTESTDFCSTTDSCSICKKYTYTCTCEQTWFTFDNILNNNCKGKSDTINNIKYSDLQISTMTICLNFNQVINLRVLGEKLKNKITLNYCPGTKKSKIPKKKGTDSFYNSFDIKITVIDRTNKNNFIYSNVSIFIFPNGKAKIAGIKTINTIYILLNELIDIISSTEDALIDTKVPLGVENVKIQMICSDFKIKPIKDNDLGWCIRQEELKNILVKEYSLSATFSALSRYPGINLKYNSIINDNKPISLLIFRSGSIIITGAKDIRDIVNSYIFIINVIKKNVKTLFYHDINEEIKQIKKNKKKLINFN